MRSDDIELGEKVLVAGFPYGELYSNTIKVTGGMVSAVKGMGDDSAQFQMDAAVQPGNSGGPIYDENGNIVGVAISRLNKLKVAKAIGSMPENVNFGIKASTVRQFLTSAGLPTKWSNRTERKSTKELAQIAKNQTVMVVCNPLIGSVPTHSKSTKLISMRKLTATLCLTIAVLLGSEVRGSILPQCENTPQKFFNTNQNL